MLEAVVEAAGLLIWHQIKTWRGPLYSQVSPVGQMG